MTPRKEIKKAVMVTYLPRVAQVFMVSCKPQQHCMAKEGPLKNRKAWKRNPRLAIMAARVAVKHQFFESNIQGRISTFDLRLI
ncbi:hypothetical protein MYX76_10155 [Desulfobacterota bacterium AH_259_B03_O07]|nr:hypothetical protein [Desulfobacterota bacterium AH_259_B03_O07]